MHSSDLKVAFFISHSFNVSRTMIATIVVLFALLYSCLSDTLSENLNLMFFNEIDYGFMPPDNIRMRGFEYQQHFAHSHDGFYLVLHRIVNPRFLKTRSSVLLNHGLMGSSNQYLMNDLSGRIDEPYNVTGPNLAFELAKKGHDVWLTDQRTSPMSSNHSKYLVTEREYWDWSNDEIALFDLPAMIDYIRWITGRQHVGYIGHSQGTEVMFKLLAKVPKYNSIVKPYIALGPAVFYGSSLPNQVSIVRALPLEQVSSILIAAGGPLLGDFARQILEELCRMKLYQVPLCIPIGYLALTLGSFVFFPNLPAMRMDRVPVYLSSAFHFALSSHQAAQDLQLIYTNRAAMTDYDPARNVKQYGKPIPPVYDMGAVTNPYIALFSARYDIIADPYDVSQLRDELGVKPMFDEHITDPFFGHFSFVFGTKEKVVPYVVKPILSIMDSLYSW